MDIIKQKSVLFKSLYKLVLGAFCIFLSIFIKSIYFVIPALIGLVYAFIGISKLVDIYILKKEPKKPK